MSNGVDYTDHLGSNFEPNVGELMIRVCFDRYM